MSNATQPHEFDLPIGLRDADGNLHRRALVRKMRGHEEALLYERDLGLAGLVSHIIGGTLLRLGSLEAPGPEVASRLYSADRNYLLLQVRRTTLGDEMRASYTCPACTAEVRIVERLGRIPVRSLVQGGDPESVPVELEDGYTGRDGTEHRSVILRLPRGDDEAFVAPLIERDPMKAADALTLRCIRTFGSLPREELEAYGLRILRDLSLGDRLRLQRALSDDSPGADLRREVRCSACDTRFGRLLDVSDFFVPCWAGDIASSKRSSTWPTTSIGPGARS
jgi:hypothetical protein